MFKQAQQTLHFVGHRKRAKSAIQPVEGPAPAGSSCLASSDVKENGGRERNTIRASKAYIGHGNKEFEPEKWMDKYRDAERRYLRMAVEAACEIFSYQDITDSPAGVAVRMGKNNLAASRTEISVPPSPPAATDRRRGSYTAPLPESLKLRVGHGQELASSQKIFQYPSLDDYLASLCRSVPAVFPELGAGGGAARSRDSEEDPASTYLNLDGDELSTESSEAAAGGATNGVGGEGAVKG